MTDATRENKYRTVTGPQGAGKAPVPSHGISNTEFKKKVYNLFNLDIDDPDIGITALEFKREPTRYPIARTGWRYTQESNVPEYAEIEYTFNGAPCSDRKIVPDGWICWETK